MNNRSSKHILKTLTDDKQESEVLKTEKANTLKKQDELLDQISDGVERLKQISKTINSELISQNTLLEDFSKEVEEADKKTKALTQKTKEVEASQGSSCVIL